MRFGIFSGLLVTLSCGCGDDGGPPATDAGRDAGARDAGADAGSAGDAGAASDGGNSRCVPATTDGLCGAKGMVRVVTSLGAGMPDATGTLVLHFDHYRLGMGSNGGVPHVAATYPAVPLSAASPVQVEFDHCLGGEMWSEENCEYNLWAFLDLDGDGALDAGEPAGRTLMEISCRSAEAGCEALVLDCLDGPSCAAFADPPACRCASSCEGDGTAARIVTCS
jgi:hypothetical protein